MKSHRPWSAVSGALFCTALATPGFAFAQAQADVKPDGKFRYALGAGASYASGNTSASSVNLSGDAVQKTDTSKLEFDAKAVWGRTDGVTTAENLVGNTQYDKDFAPQWFGFGKGDFLRDKFANVESRFSIFGGVGRHVIKEENLTFDVSTGLGYTEDRYFTAAEVNDEFRTTYGRAELLLAEESNHKFTPTTTFHQKLSLYPALRSGAGYRGVFDSGLAVAMTPVLSLTAGLNYRYTSDPGDGLKKGDTLFVTGIAVKID